VRSQIADVPGLGARGLDMPTMRTIWSTAPYRGRANVEYTTGGLDPCGGSQAEDGSYEPASDDVGNPNLPIVMLLKLS